MLGCVDRQVVTDASAACVTPEILLTTREFYFKVHGKVCTTKNLISGHKMAP